MKITTTTNLAKRVYNLIAHEARVPRVVLATCKVGRPKYISVISMYIPRWCPSDVTIGTSQPILCFQATFRQLKKKRQKPGLNGCLRGQDMLLAINYRIRTTFNRK